eukprot:TRINITY_DN10137_c0_g1_i1.p1 TRINITY_DN10137_c0_g1~~TRINITY_DN10137_c0_g1_i1.p1  ORF type:complete len:508 (+),score=181.66 TRINITY_DN10137_c0_g1_i1:105-1628(+)
MLLSCVSVAQQAGSRLAARRSAALLLPSSSTPHHLRSNQGFPFFRPALLLPHQRFVTEAEATTPPATKPVGPPPASTVTTAAKAATAAAAAATTPTTDTPTVLLTLPNFRNLETETVVSQTTEEEELLNEKLEDLILPPSVFEAPFPKIVDIPDDDSKLTPFQRGLKQVMNESEVKDEIRLQWDPKEKYQKKEEKEEEMVTIAEALRSVGVDPELFRSLPKDKKDAEMALIEYLIALDLQDKSWSKPLPNISSETMLAEIKAAKAELEKKQREREAKIARGEPVEEEVVDELFKNCGGDVKKMMQKLIDNDLQIGWDGLPATYQDRTTPIASDIAEMTTFMSEFAPHVNIYNTYFKGMMPPLEKAQKKIDKYVNWRKTRLTKIIEQRRAKKAKAAETQKKEKETYNVGLLPNAMRYVRPDDPNKKLVEDFAYAIGFNNRWSEEAKKSLIEKYSALLAAPEPTGTEFEQFVYMENRKLRTQAQRDAEFEEIYLDEVRQNEGKQAEDEA